MEVVLDDIYNYESIIMDRQKANKIPPKSINIDINSHHR